MLPDHRRALFGQIERKHDVRERALNVHRGADHQRVPLMAVQHAGRERPGGLEVLHIRFVDLGERAETLQVGRPTRHRPLARTLADGGRRDEHHQARCESTGPQFEAVHSCPHVEDEGVKKNGLKHSCPSESETRTRSGGPRSRQATTIVRLLQPGLLLGIEVISRLAASVNQPFGCPPSSRHTRAPATLKPPSYTKPPAPTAPRTRSARARAAPASPTMPYTAGPHELCPTPTAPHARRCSISSPVSPGANTPPCTGANQPPVMRWTSPSACPNPVRSASARAGSSCMSTRCATRSTSRGTGAAPGAVPRGPRPRSGRPRARSRRGRTSTCPRRSGARDPPPAPAPSRRSADCTTRRWRAPRRARAACPSRGPREKESTDAGRSGAAGPGRGGAQTGARTRAPDPRLAPRP